MTPYSPLRWNWLVGLRYLQFSEGFTFASDAGDLVFDGGPDEAYYDIDIKNQMLGFQIGGVIDYCFKPRWGFRNSLKMGVYGTHITHHSRIGGSLGAATVNNVNSPWHGQDWLVNSSKDDISFLAEWDAGVTYQWARHWRARVGYRIVAVTGVAFAAEQIPTDTYTDLGDVSRIDSNGSLILHGGYAALEFSY